MMFGQDFPKVGEQATAKPVEKKEPEDPTYGKDKEFFIYEFDENRNVCICLPEQLTFIATYYIEHYYTPIDILMWLYDMAEYREQQAEQDAIDKRNAAAQKKRKVKQEEEEEEEDSTFGYS